MIEAICRLTTYDNVNDENPSANNNIIIKNSNRSKFIYVTFQNKTVIVNGEEFIDAIYRSMI